MAKEVKKRSDSVQSILEFLKTGEESKVPKEEEDEDEEEEAFPPTQVTGRY